VTRSVRPIAAQVMKATPPQQWATRINRHAVTLVEGIVATGRDLIAAKKQLGHGGWGQMFKGHPKAVAEPVRFSQDTAERFMAIARDPILANSANLRNLPLSYATLAELTKLPEETKRKALADGRIHPDMKGREVAQLRPSVPRRELPRPREDEDRRPIRAIARDVIDAGYRAVSKKVHPDTSGGSTEQMRRLNRARDVLVQLVLNW
jgi:Protein of unknown function (DUF3102)